MKIFTLICSGILFSSLMANAQMATYAEVLDKYFQVTGAAETYETVIIQTLEIQKKSLADSTVDWEYLKRTFLQHSIDELTEQLVPVYQEFLSKDDILAAIAFYESPAGKNFRKHTPEILKGSMEVGEAWGRKLGTEIQNELQPKINGE